MLIYCFTASDAIKSSEPCSVTISSQTEWNDLKEHASQLTHVQHIAFAAEWLEIQVQDLLLFSGLCSIEFWYALQPYPRLEKLPLLAKPKLMQLCHLPPGLDTLAFMTPGMVQFPQLHILSCAHLVHLHFHSFTHLRRIHLHHLQCLETITWPGNKLQEVSLVDLPRLHQLNGLLHTHSIVFRNIPVLKALMHADEIWIESQHQVQDLPIQCTNQQAKVFVTAPSCVQSTLGVQTVLFRTSDSSAWQTILSKAQ
jgi:hypothetical protein